MVRKATRTLIALACVGLLAVTACSDTTGPGVGDVSVILSGDAVSPNRIGDGVSLSLGDVPESAVSNLFLTITRVDLHLVGGSDDTGTEGTGGDGGEGVDDSSWISLELSLTEPVDVLTLSTGGIQLAAGTVTAGRYNQARFFFDTSELVLSDAIVVNGQTIDAGSYDVTVPSAAQTGLKLSLSATEVSDGETETVAVDLGTGATIGTLVWNANGFQLSPVLSIK